jgi:hypothetical protein
MGNPDEGIKTRTLMVDAVLHLDRVAIDASEKPDVPLLYKF